MSKLGLPHSLSRKLLCPLPQAGTKGGPHSPAGEGVGESQFRLLEKKLSTLPILCVLKPPSPRVNLNRELLWPRASPYHLLWPERPVPPFLPHHHGLHPKGGGLPPAPPMPATSPPFLGFFFQPKEAGGQEAELRRRQQHSLAQFMEGPFFRFVLMN